MKRLKLGGMFLCIFVSTGLLAAESVKDYSAESQLLLKDLQAHIQGTMLAVAESERKAGNNIKDFYYSNEVPAYLDSNLGLVLDVDNLTTGYKVLSITPGSTAEESNISVGDLILAIDDIGINQSTNTKVLEKLQQLTPGSTLKLKLSRQGKVSQINMLVKGRYVPAVRLEIGSKIPPTEALDSTIPACGQVSVFFHPPASKDIYPARIHQIDDENYSRIRHSFRLTPGKHIIKLHELISDPSLTRRGRGIRRAKAIEINVEADTIYYLGAQFVRSKKYSMVKEKYWEPVIWKSEQKQCQL